MQNFSRRKAVRLAALAVAFTFVTAIPSLAAGTVPLSIGGYDPVAYFTAGRAVRGQPAFQYDWDERRYYFSSAEHRDLFKAEPVRYAPQFGNYCAMALSKGDLDEANPENWLISDGKLYIFNKAAPMGPALFQQDLAGNIAKANQNRGLIEKR
jgi:YHS domain-containing protein